MKALKSIAIAAVVLLMACDKDQDDIIENVVGSMEASISTTAWKATAPGAVLTDTAMVITGIDLNETTIAVTALGTSTGTYSLVPADAQGTGIYRLKGDTGSVFYGAVRGSLVITEINTSDKKISGTFSFDAYKNSTDSVQIRSGKFTKVNYTGG